MGWADLFSKAEAKPFCSSCREKFQFIEGKTCQVCDRPFALLPPSYKVDDRCIDCVRWEKEPRWAGALDRNYSMVMYNDFAKELIAQYKYRGDFVLSHVFASLMKKKIAAIPFDQVVPIPLSEERLYERGFNQSEALAKACGFNPIQLLTRTHTEKQSKKSRSDRIHLAQVFQVSDPIPDQHILLLDDIYTTGSTLRHAAQCLKAAGARTVSSFTFARG